MASSSLLSIFGTLNKLQEKFSSTASSSCTFHVPKLKQLNDRVYEVHSSQPGEKPEVEVVFFHGLQVGRLEDAYVTTWMTRDNSQLWLQTWLVELFPKARIFTVSYDSSAKRTHESGRLDIYCTGENLVYSLTADDVRIGQAGCPVVLVGHCLGGLVLKELCLHAAWILGRKSAERFGVQRVDDLFSNLRGMFFYATPHTGSIVGDELHDYFEGALLEEIKTMKASSARRNQEFDDLKSKHGWLTSGIGERYETYVECLGKHIHMVPEASTRPYMDTYYSAAADHYNVCKPQRKNDSAVVHLQDFLKPILLGKHIHMVPEALTRPYMDTYYSAAADHYNVCKPQRKNDSAVVHLQDFLKPSTDQGSTSTASRGVAVLPRLHQGEGYTVDLAAGEVIGLDEPVKKLVERLKGEARLGIVGIGGLGKTTLAKALFNSISKNFEYTCFMEDVKTKVESKVDPMKLRRKITNNLYYKRKKVDQEFFSWNTLQGKRVLIVLDDVDSESQFSVMTVHDGFASESRVIVTSRDKRLLEQNDFENCHFHKLLKDEDSRKLFCKHAFKTVVAPSGYEERVENFVKKCGSLPLALRVGGKYLHTQGELWDDALKKSWNAESLSGTKIDQLWSILEVTYDSLAESEQEMFLDIATCLFYMKRLEDVKQAWRVCSLASPNSGWVNLVDKGLVTTTRVYLGFREGWMECIQMHEILRDFGRKRAGFLHVI